MVTDRCDIAGSEVFSTSTTGVVVITPGELSCTVSLQDFAGCRAIGSWEDITDTVDGDTGSEADGVVEGGDAFGDEFAGGCEEVLRSKCLSGDREEVDQGSRDRVIKSDDRIADRETFSCCEGSGARLVSTTCKGLCCGIPQKLLTNTRAGSEPCTREGLGKEMRTRDRANDFEFGSGCCRADTNAIEGVVYNERCGIEGDRTVCRETCIEGCRTMNGCSPFDDEVSRCGEETLRMEVVSGGCRGKFDRLCILEEDLSLEYGVASDSESS